MIKKKASVQYEKNSGVRGKISQLEYEASGRSSQVARIQKSMSELNTMLKKIEKKKKK